MTFNEFASAFRTKLCGPIIAACLLAFLMTSWNLAEKPFTVKDPCEKVGNRNLKENLFTSRC